MNNAIELKIAFFGGEPLGVPALEALHEVGLTPELIVCNPDRPSGRGHQLTPPPVKQWALTHGVETFQPGSFGDEAELERLTNESWDLFVVVAYNHILPKEIIEIPKHGTINLHPSLLPLYRGPSPIRTAILEDNPDAIGVSIMLMDEEMDHGPLLAQKVYESSEWPLDGVTLDKELAAQGGQLLVETIPCWLDGEITPAAQDHERATYTKKLTKDMGLLELDPLSLPSGEEAKTMLSKIKGLAGWPGTYFYFNNQRIKLLDARLDGTGTLSPVTVVPEGKPVIAFSDWLAKQ